MRYTKEYLEELPSKKLVEIILQLQSENNLSISMKRKLERISKLLEEDMIATTEALNKETVSSSRGRKPFTPEQRAAAYERQKERQREKYRLAHQKDGE